MSSQDDGALRQYGAIVRCLTKRVRSFREARNGGASNLKISQKKSQLKVPSLGFESTTYFNKAEIKPLDGQQCRRGERPFPKGNCGGSSDPTTYLN